MTAYPGHGSWRAGVISAAVSLVFSGLLLPVFGQAALPELLLGWFCACLNAALHHAINRRAVGSEARGFLVWGIAMNALRIALLLAIFACVLLFTERAFAPFGISLAGGVIVFLPGGILTLVGRMGTRR